MIDKVAWQLETIASELTEIRKCLSAIADYLVAEE